MDTMENELQALRKELDTFRDENIALYNELTNQNKTLYKEIVALREENFSLCKELAQNQAILLQTIKFFGIAPEYENISNRLATLTGMQTAEFVMKNMRNVKVFSPKNAYVVPSKKARLDDVRVARKKHIAYALEQVTLWGIRGLQGHEHKFYRYE